MLELTHDELDLVVIGQVMAGCFSGETSSHRGQERGKTYTMFHHNGIRICQKTFLFLHTMGYGCFKAIKASYRTSGVVALQGPRQQREAKEDGTVTEADSGHRAVHHELYWYV